MAGPCAVKPSKSTPKKATTAKATPKKETGSPLRAHPAAHRGVVARGPEPTVVVATDGQPISELIDGVGAGGETHQTAGGAHRTG